MSFVELIFFPPLMLAVAVVVGTAGRERGEIASSIRRSFIALTLGVLAVGALVRLLVVLFA